MTSIVLHRYYNNQALSLNSDDIDTMKRFSAEHDAGFHPLDPFPYTAITLKKGAKTSEGVGTAYVKETPSEILKLAV
jgi:hypothetical protein